MISSKSRLLWGAVALATLALVVRTFMPAPVPVVAGPLERGPMRVTLDEDGKVRAYDRYVVTAPVAGRLLRVALREGDRVEAGQVVARIAPEPLTRREREEQQARLAAARALKLEADEQVRQAQAALEQATRERKRAESLVAQKFVSAQAAEQARIAETAAAATFDAARFRASAGAAEVRAAEAGLISLRAGSTTLVDVGAPVAGEVLQLHEKSERVLAVGTPIATLGDPSRFEIVLDYLTIDAVKIRPGMTVLLENWGGGTLKARVRRVEPGAFTKISALGIEEQRTNVIADFIDPPGPLKDGYRVEGRVVVWEADAVLKVPVSSLFRRNGGWAVFAVSDGRARLKPVDIGQRNALEAEVLEGVAEGDRIIRHPPQDLTEHARVTVQTYGHK